MHSPSPNAPAESRRESTFDPRLESLRGLAALLVAVGHCAFVFPPLGLERLVSKGLTLLFNGSAAVAVFFVLSGVVLERSIRRQQTSGEFSFANYFLRRLFRIFPAYLVSCVLILAFLPWFHRADTSALAPWSGTFYQATLDLPFLLRNLFMIDSGLNPVSWTLACEIIGSAFIPTFARLHRHGSPAARLAVGAALLLLCLLPIGPVNPLRFLFAFYLGVGLESGGFRGRLQVSRLQLPVALTLLLTPGLLSGGLMPLRDALQAIGAAWLVAIFLQDRTLDFRQVLASGPLRFLGRVSYSFYLVHFPIMHGLALLFAARLIVLGYLPLTLLLGLLSIAAALALSSLMFKFVEDPCIRLGKQIRA